jgi:hypothetical protein
MQECTPWHFRLVFCLLSAAYYRFAAQLEKRFVYLNLAAINPGSNLADKTPKTFDK